MKVFLCKVHEIPDVGAKKVDFLGREALVFQCAGKPRVILNLCMHLGGPMKLDGDKFVCEWHGAEFDCRNGLRRKGPARRDSRLIILPTRIEGVDLMYVYGE